MICTRSAPSNSGLSHCTASQRETYLYALEQEREEVLTEAYARKILASPRSHTDSRYTSDFGYYTSVDTSHHSMYDERGRQRNFRETVSQRQERLEFIRRQECARRLAHKGRQDPSVSEYAIKRLAPPHSRPAERVQAAVKIQRAYRAYRALGALAIFERRIIAASNALLDTHSALSYLRARAAELGALGALLDVAPQWTDDPRVLRKVRRVTETLRRAFERAERLEKEREGRGVWVHQTRVAHVASGRIRPLNTIPKDDSSDSELDDFDYSRDFGAECSKRRDIDTTTPSNDNVDWRWMDGSSSDSDSDSDSSDNTEEDLELGSGVPKGADAGISEVRRAAIIALCSGSARQQEWIAQILTAPPLHRPEQHSSVSKVPALLTVSEESEREA